MIESGERSESRQLVEEQATRYIYHPDSSFQLLYFSTAAVASIRSTPTSSNAGDLCQYDPGC